MSRQEVGEEVLEMVEDEDPEERVAAALLKDALAQARQNRGVIGLNVETPASDAIERTIENALEQAREAAREVVAGREKPGEEREKRGRLRRAQRARAVFEQEEATRLLTVQDARDAERMVVLTRKSEELGAALKWKLVEVEAHQRRQETLEQQFVESVDELARPFDT
jgi:hypothetical protein